MVALNWQTSDTSLLIYKTFFRQNGGCGFVRKVQKNQDPTKNNKNMASIDSPKRKTKNFRFTIISATKFHTFIKETSNKDPQEIVMDPFITLDLYDYDPVNPKIEKDCVLRQCTDTIYDNAWLPIWGLSQQTKNDPPCDVSSSATVTAAGIRAGATENLHRPKSQKSGPNILTFYNICQDTAYLVIKAKDKIDNLKEQILSFNQSDDDIGRVVIPLTNVREGYRIVNLESKNAERTDGAQVFMRIEIL